MCSSDLAHRVEGRLEGRVAPVLERRQARVERFEGRSDGGLQVRGRGLRLVRDVVDHQEPGALGHLDQRLAALAKQVESIRKAARTTMITVAIEPRTMRILPRGNWLDESGEVVSPNTPAALPPLQRRGERADRLDLARWLNPGAEPQVAYALVLSVEAAIAVVALVLLSRVNLRQFREDTGRSLNRVLAAELG